MLGSIGAMGLAGLAGCAGLGGDGGDGGGEYLDVLAIRRAGRLAGEATYRGAVYRHFRRGFESHETIEQLRAAAIEKLPSSYDAMEISSAFEDGRPSTEADVDASSLLDPTVAISQADDLLDAVG